jgi:hypothetical protein
MPLDPLSRAARLIVAALPLALAAACAQLSGMQESPRADGLLHAEYVPEVDSTYLRTAPVPVGGGLSAYAGFAFLGRELQPGEEPAEVSLVFEENSSSPQWERAEGRSLTLVLDDSTRLAFDRTEYRHHVAAGRGKLTTRVVEWVWVRMPVRDFRALAHARRAEGELHRTRVVLDDEALAAFRALVARMGGDHPTGP